MLAQAPPALTAGLRARWLQRAPLTYPQCVRLAVAVVPPSVASCSLWTSLRLSQTHSAEVKRPSRRRYAALNKGGRVGRAKELAAQMKAMPKGEAKSFYDALLPRDKLDVVRLLHEKRRKRRGDRIRSALPKHYSAIFERNYFFKEEDLKEESTLGRGPGGQATNRRMQTAIVRHVPSGIVVKFSRFPSLWLNRRAARELLHLRLEEHLVGPLSRLGKARVASERLQRRRQRTVTYLIKKGTKLQAREAQACRWAAFHIDGAPLPAVATLQMSQRTSAEPITLALLFGAECNSWWPKLKAAVDAASAADKEMPTQVPLMLRFVFPAVYGEHATAQERAEWEKCRANSCIRANVARAFVCFCELFGLQLRSATAAASTPPSSEQRCSLHKDGLNWVEYRSRLHHDGHLTLVGRVCWPHVYLSLKELGLLAEARAIVAFLKKEAKAGQQVWAEETLRCCAVATRESRTTAPQSVAVADTDRRAVQVRSV